MTVTTEIFSVTFFLETNFSGTTQRNGKLPGILRYRYQIPGNFLVPVQKFSGTDTGIFLGPIFFGIGTIQKGAKFL